MTPLRSILRRRFAFLLAAAVIVGAVLAPRALHGQAEAADGPALAGAPGAAGVPVDTTGMARGPWSRLSMLYEVTIFNVDVLELEIRVDSATAGRLEELGGEALETSAPAGEGAGDAMADAVVQAPASIIRTRFCRDVPVDRFLSGAVDNLEHARRAGHVSREEVERITGEIGAQFSTLEDRGFRDGDTLWYEIRGDSLVMVVQGRGGSVLLRDVADGMDRRSALLGGYLAPTSDFRDKLLRSLGPGS